MLFERLTETETHQPLALLLLLLCFAAVWVQSASFGAAVLFTLFLGWAVALAAYACLLVLALLIDAAIWLSRRARP